MEYTLYKHLKMPVTPHLLILPSILRPFIYVSILFLKGVCFQSCLLLNRMSTKPLL